MLCNTQSELHPLEEGKHAAESKKESGLDLKEYATAAGKKYATLYNKVRAYRVASVCDIANATAQETWNQLVEIHAAPQWLWPALVEKMTSEAWTVAWAPRARVGGTSIRADRGELKRGSPRARGRHC